jgi:uncharacterized protein (TIGR03083 family)
VTTSDAEFDRTAFLSAVDASWQRLQAEIAAIPAAKLTGPTDPAGWTAKDHLAHLAAWERSMLFLLKGRPRHEGLRVAEEVYLSGDYDRINDAIFQHVRDQSLADVIENHAGIHARLREVMDTLPTSEYLQPYNHFLPDEPGRDDGRPIHERLGHNLGEHYTEHLGYIRALVGRD